MAIGIGENSPVKPQLTRESFNALIIRHSQPIRWLTAHVCPCIGQNRKVDENCPICLGDGLTYNVTTENINIKTEKPIINGVFELSGVISIRDFQGNELSFQSEGCMTYCEAAIKGRDYRVTYKESVLLSGTGPAVRIGPGLYEIDIPVQIEFGNVQGTLETVDIENKGIFRNCFELEEDVPGGFTVNYTYVNPFKFALLTNKLDKEDQKFLVDVGGDGILIFPQKWEIFDKDIIVALNATQVEKTVLRMTGDIDTVPSPYIHKINECFSLRDEEKHFFIPETDVIVYKGNKIKWISENKPTEGEQVSFNYTYCLVYRVVKEMPASRTSEDNRFPRKVAIKVHTGISARDGF